MSERKLLFLMNAQQAEAFARLLEAANRGDGDAACRLGDMYREALGGLRYSPKETFRWYARSAMAGDANGRNNLGACYEHGLGCVQSYRKAVKWYRLSAAQELGTASMNLGYCYLHGHGVPADKAEALRLLRLAARQGEDKAARQLEKMGEPLEEPNGQHGGREDAGGGTRSRTRDRVRFMDLTKHGSHFGIVGGFGVDPTAPEKKGT